MDGIAFFSFFLSPSVPAFCPVPAISATTTMVRGVVSYGNPSSYARLFCLLCYAMLCYAMRSIARSAEYGVRSH